ncbi:MAG TPA: hypothetical protein VFB95_06055 [Candidatus Cryosericum sp.]|nr:hypothetical protein [Candidatus Cryosericum sp.]
MFPAIAIAGVLLAAAGAFVVDRGSAQQPPAPASPVPAPDISLAQQSLPPPLASGPVPDLDLAFTAQVIGWIEPCG